MEATTERVESGFAGEKTFSANQAFKEYQNATGNKKTKFKDWLHKQKESGNLNNLLQKGKTAAGTLIQQKLATMGGGGGNDNTSPSSDPSPDPNPAPTTGMSHGLKIGLIIGGVVVAAAIVFMVVRAKKSKNKPEGT